ncbi:MAG: RES family NAD+ phosphorylase [Bryobacteraceae bacterium]
MPRAHPSKESPEHARLRRTVAAARRQTALRAWRAVEGQHVVSTMRLVENDPARQQLLESILEESKPPLPPDAGKLHYLLATPFRYPPSEHGSRFRSRLHPGVLYAAMGRRTACAEMGYWRWRFVQDSVGLDGIPAAAQTLFQLGAKGIAVDLREPPLVRASDRWTSPGDYSETQRLGSIARDLDVALVLYRSVRDPEHGGCVAIFEPSAIHPRQPLARETWYLTVSGAGAIWQHDADIFSFRFA